VPIYGRSSRREHHVPAQPGRPRRYARGRPRRAHHGRRAAGQGPPTANRKTGSIYTPKATKIAEDLVIAAWTEAGCPRLEGPIHFGLSVVVARPGGHFLKNGELSAAGLRAPYPIRRPDLDNCLKLAAMR
jgi:Holliday junction resolvase RusA-like endonuclease